MQRWSTLLGALAASVLLASHSFAAEAPDPRNWEQLKETARGQTVYWYAWGGEQSINRYIAWVGEQALARYGVAVEQVKISDTAEAVAKVIAEKAAGRIEGGSVDLIWINGANFASLKNKGLLFGPWADDLPNRRYVDVKANPAVTADFTVSIDGLESPWDMAQLVFFHDTEKVPSPPRTMKALLGYAQAHPGRITYPDAQNFLGATFLKQALIELISDRSVLERPVDEGTFDDVTAPLWDYLDQLRGFLWRRGQAYPSNSAELRQLMADGEVDLAFSFNPSEASLAIASKQLPTSVRSYVLNGGTIGNASFVAIPFNAAHKEGAMVVANLLLSPEAQARKQDAAVWGGNTVLTMNRLSPEDRLRFESLKRGVATLPPDEMGRALPEPHPSWMTRITEKWIERYASQ